MLCQHSSRASRWNSFPILEIFFKHGCVSQFYALSLEACKLHSLSPIMALRSLCTRYLRLPVFVISFVYIRYAWAFTGSTYQLDAEYSGNNFFDGWDFFTVGDSKDGSYLQS